MAEQIITDGRFSGLFPGWLVRVVLVFIVGLFAGVVCLVLAWLCIF
jgi:hypothetical protein